MATNNATNTSNPITVAQGGTGLATLTAHSVQVGAGTSNVTQVSVGTNGQCLLGSTGADPVFATLTSSGGTITYTTGAGTLNLDTTYGPGDNWTVVTGTSQSAAVNNGYIANNAGLVTVTLPTTAAVGTIQEVTGINNATGWKIAQNASQQIFFGSASTTSGTGGSLASTATRDSVKLVCVVANLTWNVISSIGNITVT